MVNILRIWIRNVIIYSIAVYIVFYKLSVFHFITQYLFIFHNCSVLYKYIVFNTVYGYILKDLLYIIVFYLAHCNVSLIHLGFYCLSL